MSTVAIWALTQRIVRSFKRCPICCGHGCRAKRSISAKNWHAKKSSEASLKSQVASAFQLIKKATLEPLATWLLVRRLRLCSCVVWPRLLVLTQTAPQALCLTITRRQRHHGQSISRWSLYQARRLRTEVCTGVCLCGSLLTFLGWPFAYFRLICWAVLSLLSG